MSCESRQVCSGIETRGHMVCSCEKIVLVQPDWVLLSGPGRHVAAVGIRRNVWYLGQVSGYLKTNA